MLLEHIRQVENAEMRRWKRRGAACNAASPRRPVRGACIMQNAVLPQAATSLSAAGAGPTHTLFQKRPAQAAPSPAGWRGWPPGASCLVFAPSFVL